MNQEFLDSLIVNSKHETLSLVVSCVVKNGNGGDYVMGTLKRGSEELAFKVWNSSAAFPLMKDGTCGGKVCLLSGTIKDYNGKYLDVVSCEITDESIEPYLDVVYNLETYENFMWKILERNVSEQGLVILNKILKEDNPDIYERFRKEFAAKTFHDNCLNGLLAHTCKCLNLLESYSRVYPLLFKYKGEEEEQKQKDLYFIGMTLHDIGKIHEMNFGTYQHRSIITHRVIGLEMIFPYKEEIVEMYGIEWYDFLLSIISQHHGSYGEDTRTLPAMVIHMIDELDSKSTYLISQLKDGIKSNECGETIYYKMPDVIKSVTPYFNV